MRIAEFLVEQRVAFESLPHAPAYTAQQLAKHLRLPGAEVAKCVLLRGPAGYVLAVLPATHQVNTDSLWLPLGGPVRLAIEAEIGEVFPDCEWGVVPPFGVLYGLKSIIDESLRPETMIVFEGHSRFQAIRMRCADFERLERPRRLRFAVRGDDPGIR
jgi:Ala-tRNA(Pro) deacylase